MSEIPFNNNSTSDPESRPPSAHGAPTTASQAPSATVFAQAVPSSASKSAPMAAQYYAKRVEEPPKPTGMMLPALAAAIAPGQVQDTRYRSPYSAPELSRPPHALAPIAPMAPMAMASGSNTPDPGAARPFPNLNEANRMLNRTSSESQTDEHHDPPEPVTMPGNNQYTPGVQRVSHPGTPQPTPGDGSKPPRPRPHVCLTCQRTFVRREHLNRHELSHTKEKPFECNECSRCFSRRDLLLRHKQKLHITNPYVRPRDRAKGDGPSDGDSPMAQMSQLSGNDGTTGVSIAIHPSGQVQRSHDAVPGSGPPGQQDGDRGGPSSMAMAHMRPALPTPRAHPGQPQQSQPPPQLQPAGSAASLYYQKQDIDVSKIDLSRFRSLGRSSPSPHPTGPPPPQQVARYQGPYHAPPQGAPVPVSPHAQHRHVEVPRPLIEPINHDLEESGFHIPFAKRPRRDTDGRSRAAHQARHEQGQQSHLAEPRKSGAFPQHMTPTNQYEPPHSLLDQLAIAAVPGEQPKYKDRGERMPQAPMGMSYSQPPHQPEQEVWRSPGGTHRVVQFDHSPHPSHATPAQSHHPSAMDTSGLAPPSPNMQTRSPSQGRKRSLQDEDKEEEEGMKMQGGFRRSMRRALSMSMEDSQRPAALLKALEDAAAKETAEMKDEKRRRAKKSATPEGGRPNVRYVKPQTSKGNLKDKTEKVEKVEKKATSPVRGRKPSAKAKAAKEAESEEVTPEKRGRGRPPKATPALSAKSKKFAKATKAVEESENEEDEQAAIEEQLAQEEKRTRSAMKETKKADVKETKTKNEEEETPAGRTFRSVRLQAKYIDKK